VLRRTVISHGKDAGQDVRIKFSNSCIRNQILCRGVKRRKEKEIEGKSAVFVCALLLGYECAAPYCDQPWKGCGLEYSDQVFQFLHVRNQQIEQFTGKEKEGEGKRRKECSFCLCVAVRL
jgi:hypothetical protein